MSEQIQPTCQGWSNGVRCGKPATHLVISENIGRAADQMAACGSCANAVDGCDGVTVEPIAAVRDGGEKQS